MALSISDIVNVQISVSPTALPLAGFGELLLVTDETGGISLAERTKKYNSLKEVQEDWDADTEVVNAATAYFAQTPQPDQFTVGLLSNEAYAASFVGGAHGTLEQLKAVSAGAFNITIDGSVINPTGINLSTATDLSGVAAIIQTALDGELTGTACTYRGGRFVITSPTQGVASTITYATGGADNLDALLGLRQADSGTIVNGGNAETPVAALGAITDISNTPVAVTFTRNFRDNAQVLDIANWCEASKKIFLNTTNDIACLSATTASTTIAGQLKDRALRYTITTYNQDIESYPSCSLFGRIATVNYEGTNTTITLKFKKMPTISVTKLRSSQKKALDSINVGAFLDYSGFSMYAESRMADGGWMDTVHGLLWLENRIQNGVFNLLTQSTTKIPYTDTGVNMVVGRVVDALQQGVTNGLLAAGMTANDEYLEFGYKVTTIPVAKIAKADKSNRIYRGITFECVGAGALQGVTITGTFSE